MDRGHFLGQLNPKNATRGSRKRNLKPGFGSSCRVRNAISTEGTEHCYNRL